MSNRQRSTAVVARRLAAVTANLGPRRVGMLNFTGRQTPINEQRWAGATAPSRAPSPANHTAIGVSRPRLHCQILIERERTRGLGICDRRNEASKQARHWVWRVQAGGRME